MWRDGRQKVLYTVNPRILGLPPRAKAAMLGVNTIGHFRVPPVLCIKTRLSAQPLIWKWFFILMQIKLIFTRKVVHLASFWRWGLWNSEVSHRICSRRIYMKMEFSSQRREMFLFLITNMAAVTSRAKPTVREKIKKMNSNWTDQRNCIKLFPYKLKLGK